MRRSVGLGLVCVVLAAAVLIGLRFWPGVPSVRYVAEGKDVAVSVSLRQKTSAPLPPSLTVELPSGERLIAQPLR